MRECWKKRYSIEHLEDVYECLTEIAKSRHCIVRGSELDTEKAAAIAFLDDFRSGKLGRISLERPTVIIKRNSQSGKREDRERQIEKKTAGGKCEEKEQKQQKE